MNNEAGYKKAITAALEAAQAVEAKWAAQSPANAALAARVRSEGIGSGEYREMPWKEARRTAWTGWDAPCPRCGAAGERLHSRDICAGCRMNGDGYGSCTVTCPTCGLFCWWSYDEA